MAQGNNRVSMALPHSDLRFSQITPVAPEGLGGLLQDRFTNGRLFTTMSWYGGWTRISYCGTQHLGALEFFHADLETAWYKPFRSCVRVDGKRYYLPSKNTKLYPFGLAGESRVIGMDFNQEMLLLPDTVVQRYSVIKNPRKLPVGIEMFHHERICRKELKNRTWSQFEFDPKLNAMIASCVDENPVVFTGDGDSMSQQGLGLVVKDAPHATTWIGLGCDVPMTMRTSFNDMKVYINSELSKAKATAFFLVFADSREKLAKRLEELSKTVHKECDALVAGYERRLRTRPRINVGNPVLNSAFGQYPEFIHFMNLSDRPGAVRAGIERSFVWGWDGLTPLASSPWANEPELSRDVLRFFQDTWNPVIGLPLQFTTSFQARIKEPFPAQAQYIAGVYHYVAATGDLGFAREVLPTCKNILERCKERLVADTGLVASNALWPDFPEAMDETGDDISALNNSFLYQGLRSMEYLANALGEQSLARECRDWAKRLRANFVKYLFDEEKGFFITSCSSKDLSPRKHYGCQTVYWVTPFARELVSHAAGRIAAFMQEHLRAPRCLLSLPQWDTAWMAEGNQLGSSFPPADYFYVNVHKLLGDERALNIWLSDVEWFWRFHTIPEAFTPEAENEDAFGPDNHGGKQTQAATTWYTLLYTGLAGLDIDHEGITFTPWGDKPVEILGLRLHGVVVDLRIKGKGRHVGSLKLNGKPVPAGARKISWKDFKGKSARIELGRSEKSPKHPVIVRADGLRVANVEAKAARLTAIIDGDISGEVVIQTAAKSKVLVNGQPVPCVRDASTGTISIPFPNEGKLKLDVTT